MVAPERETPGISATTCAVPMARAFENGTASRSEIVGCGRRRSTSSITTPPAMKAAAITPGL